MGPEVDVLLSPESGKFGKMVREDLLADPNKFGPFAFPVFL